MWHIHVIPTYRVYRLYDNTISFGVTNHFNTICRLGGGPKDCKDVMNHEFFKSIEFDDILAKKVREIIL